MYGEGPHNTPEQIAIFNRELQKVVVDFRHETQSALDRLDEKIGLRERDIVAMKIDSPELTGNIAGAKRIVSEISEKLKEFDGLFKSDTAK